MCTYVYYASPFFAMYTTHLLKIRAPVYKIAMALQLATHQGQQPVHLLEGGGGLYGVWSVSPRGAPAWTGWGWRWCGGVWRWFGGCGCHLWRHLPGLDGCGGGLPQHQAPPQHLPLPHPRLLLEATQLFANKNTPDIYKSKSGNLGHRKKKR